jgi:branched-subunit amino acid ABC-type transport system permease component
MEPRMTKQAHRWQAYKAGVLLMKQNFAVIVLGGTGQVGGATVTELLTIPECREW